MQHQCDSCLQPTEPLASTLASFSCNVAIALSLARVLRITSSMLPRPERSGEPCKAWWVSTKADHGAIFFSPTDTFPGLLALWSKQAVGLSSLTGLVTKSHVVCTLSRLSLVAIFTLHVRICSSEYAIFRYLRHLIGRRLFHCLRTLGLRRRPTITHLRKVSQVAQDFRAARTPIRDTYGIPHILAMINY